MTTNDPATKLPPLDELAIRVAGDKSNFPRWKRAKETLAQREAQLSLALELLSKIERTCKTAQRTGPSIDVFADVLLGYIDASGLLGETGGWG